MSDPVIDRKTKLEDLPEFLTPNEVCGFLGLCSDSVYKLIEEGELPARRFGQRIFISKKAFMEEVAVA